MFSDAFAHLLCKYAENIHEAIPLPDTVWFCFVSQEHRLAALVLLDPPIVFQHVEHPQRIEIQFTGRETPLPRTTKPSQRSERWSVNIQATVISLRPQNTQAQRPLTNS